MEKNKNLKLGYYMLIYLLFVAHMI